LLWLAETAGTVFAIGLPNGLTRFLAGLQGGGGAAVADALTRWVFLRFAGMSLAGAAFLAGFVWLSGSVSAPSVLVPLVCALYVVQAFGGIYLADLCGRQQFAVVARVNALSGLVLAAGVGIGSFAYGITGALAGYTAGSALPAWRSLAMAQSLGQAAPLSPDLRKRVREHSFFSWLASLITLVTFSRLEVFFLQRYWPADEVAMFAVALAWSALLSQGPLLLSGAFLPHFAHHAEMGNMAGVRRAYASGTRVIAFLLFPLCAWGAAAAPVLLPAMYGPAFRPAIVGAIVLTACSMLAVGQVGSALLYGMERSRCIALVGAVGSVAFLVSGVTVIRVGGAWGAVWARLVIQAGMVGVGLWYIARRLNCPVPLAGLARTLAAALASAVPLALSVVAGGELVAVLTGGCAALVFYAMLARRLVVLAAEDLDALRRAARERAPDWLAGWTEPVFSFLAGGPRSQAPPDE
jgi:O-antigen/teichoic acid export membrane protein